MHRHPTQRHGRDGVAANVAMLVIPRQRREFETIWIVLPILFRNENAMAAGCRIPPASTAPLYHRVESRIRAFVGNKDCKGVDRGNPAFHPRKRRELSALFGSHGLHATCNLVTGIVLRQA